MLNFLKKNKNLSKSVVYGFRKSNYEEAVMDGDLQHRPINLIKLMMYME